MKITVTAPPAAPSLSQIPPNQTAKVSAPLALPIVATDPTPGSTLSVVSTPLPGTATLTGMSGANSTTYTFQWTPAAADAGKSYSVCFKAVSSNGQSSIGMTCVQIAVASS